METLGGTTPNTGVGGTAGVIGSTMQMPRGSFSGLEFGHNTEALLNSSMTRPALFNLQGPCISELLSNQMPSHKMSIDFTNRHQPDPK